MRRVLCFLLFLLAAAVPTVFAEEVDERDSNRYRYSILGDVVDENGQPMPGATVRVLGTTFGAGTDSDGEFVIRLENAKEYTLLVSFIGYESQEIKAVPAVRPPRLHIRLVPSSNQLNDVVVTGSFVAKPLKEVPVLTRVISQKEIQALNPMNVETLLQYELPGLQIGYNSMSQMPEISYQGMDGEYMLFLIDGERVSGEGADHNVDFTRFNVDDIERIEVIKGAQSTIYGSNALGGVINIITKTANRPFSGNLNARYAGSNGQKYTASTGVKKNRLTSYTSLTYRTKDTYEIGDEVGKTTVTEGSDGSSAEKQADAGSTTVYGYNIWDFLQKIGYTCNEKLNADLKGSFYRNKRDKRVGKMYQDIFLDYTLNGKVTYLPGEKQQLVIGYIYDNYQKNQDYFLSAGSHTACIHSLTRCIHNLVFNKEVDSFGGTSHIGDFTHTSHLIINQMLCIFPIQLILRCTRQSNIGFHLPRTFAGNESRAGEFIGIRSYDIIARCTEFQHIIYLLATDAVRVIDITVGTGNRNNLSTQLGSLGSCTPSHISETGDSNRLTLDIYTFGFQHLVYKIQSTETGCFGTYQ